MTVRVIDQEGNERDWAWVQARYGAVTIHDPGAKSCYRVVELREVSGIMAAQATLLDEAGLPVRSAKVIYSWPDAPSQPGAGWLEKGVAEITDSLGVAEHTMGGGEAYAPPCQGPISWWVPGDPEVSEMISGLGWLAGTNHDHLQVTFEWTAGVEPPPPPDPVDLPGAIADLKSVLDDLTLIVQSLTAGMVYLGAARDLVIDALDKLGQGGQ